MNKLYELVFSSPVWGLCLTLLCYYIGILLHKKTGWTVLQPVAVSSLMIALTLILLHQDFSEYQAQNAVLDYFLALTAVVLAVPLYRSIYLLKKYALPIAAGVVGGTAAGMAAIVVFGKLLGTDPSLLISMIPKSATTAIGVPVSDIIGGLPSVTLAFIIITGTTGAVAAPEILKLFGVRNPVAKGIAIGTVSHAVGTSRAFKEGEITGAMSSLAMALAGTLTAFLSPLAAALFFS